MALLVVSPHTQYFHGFFIVQNLIDQAVLYIDEAGSDTGCVR